MQNSASWSSRHRDAELTSHSERSTMSRQLHPAPTEDDAPNNIYTSTRNMLSSTLFSSPSHPISEVPKTKASSLSSSSSSKKAKHPQQNGEVSSPKGPPQKKPQPKTQASHSQSQSHGTMPPRPRNTPSRSRSVGMTERELAHQKRKKKNRDFQHEHNAMTVSVRVIDIDTRSAFAPNRLVSTDEWKAWAARADAVRNTSIKKKMSPSLQHLELLHKFQRVSKLHQLCFSPSVGTESDIFVPWDDDIRSDEKKVTRKKRSTRDGRYRSIDPLQATLSSLPKHPPILSNRKRRLPTRSDVGFPNASQEEIMQKQEEIQHETEWEEASPRLILLVTGDGLGTTAQDEPAHCILPENLDWNGGGLDGMLLAGRDLQIAKERNLRLFSSKQRYDSFLSHQKWAQPRRASMLAPPLDASFSSTIGWRPRPFHDRPSGRNNWLACPLDVKFDIGNIEPLVCSLTLYSLPTSSPSSPGDIHGKMTEEFWFPAGDWKGLIHLDTARALAGESSDIDQLELAWHERKHKALFSYDPLVVTGGSDSIHVVLQVFKMSQLAGALPYCTNQKGRSSPVPMSSERTPTKKKRITGRIKSKIVKMGKGNGRVDKGDSTDGEASSCRSKGVYDMFGTQFLTPLCFGVVPSFPSKDEAAGAIKTSIVRWPHGSTQVMQLHSLPERQESQNEFVKRLAIIATDERCDQTVSTTPVIEEKDLSLQESQTPSVYTKGTAPDEQISDSLTVSSHGSKSKKGGSSRLLKSSSKNLRTGQNSITAPFAGTATMFTSMLGVDFTQTMLQTPPAFAPFENTEHAQTLPRLLVNVSGDCAIMVNSENEVEPSPFFRSESVPAKKRSTLVRLPHSNFPAGYADATEVREVLFLPPQVEKKYDVDIPNCTRSLMNLLYLYPRQLRFVPEDSKTKNIYRNQHFTVRIRLITTPLQVNAGTSGSAASCMEEVSSFHNPAPWSGPPMLKAVYTKIPHTESTPGKHSTSDSAKAGICMRDEIKVQLPMVLDGTSGLEFTLFAVELKDDLDDSDEEDCGISMQAIADKMVPLSSSSSREPNSGVRIATVIPNGCHRVKLGDFQLQLETRLVSSIHINDATVATALRDFPIAKRHTLNAGENSYRELALKTSRSTIGTSHSGEEMKVPFQAIFASASETVVLGHFPLLAHMHLCNMVNRSAPELDMRDVARVFKGDSKSKPGRSSPLHSDTKFMIENVQSFLEIIRKAKLKLSLKATASEASRRVELFLKNFTDTYDEFLLSESSEPETINSHSSVDKAPMARSFSVNSMETPEKPRNQSESHDEYAEDESEEVYDVGAIRSRGKVQIPKEIDRKISQTVSALNDGNGLPFSRVAFGASKTDMMRLEAEIYPDGAYATQLFDDDETIATIFTQQTAKEEDETSKWDFMDESIAGSPSKSPSAKGNSGSEATNNTGYLGDTGLLANRVRSAAQVMIGPCMTPNLSTVLASGRSYGSRRAQPYKRKSVGVIEKGTVDSYLHHMQRKKTARDIEAEVGIYNPSSDFEDEGQQLESGTTIPSGFLKHHENDKLRDENTSPLLVSSVFSPGSTIGARALPSQGETFVYESVIVSWLRAWLDYVWKNTNGQIKLPDWESSLFLIPEYDPSLQQPNEIYSFYFHKDILLPLCLKSLVVRCNKLSAERAAVIPVILDNRHLQIFVPFVEILARGLMGEALAGGNSAVEAEKALMRALSSTMIVMEFLVALFPIVHPEHVALLLSKYFQTLSACEVENFIRLENESNVEYASSFEWTEGSLRRVKCSRQLRLQSIEILSALPNFLALNYPLKLAKRDVHNNSSKASWSVQYVETTQFRTESAGKICPYLDGIERLPRSGWLADLIAGESLAICSLSCEAVVAEALAHVESSKQRDSEKDPLLRNRPGKTIQRKDYLMFQSTAVHAINVMYELLIRRHAMDGRFQTNKCRERTAAVLAPRILHKSLGSTRWLARMEASHKVRSLWLLCFIYVLQEAPEAMLREKLISYCLPDNFLVHRFIRLLRLSSATFQCFFDQDTNPSTAPKEMSTWLVQESYNTICAATNMLVDECAIPMSIHPREQKKMVQGVLDLLLHIITAPQSSVTHLRALGGALQAMNKFGVALFLEIVGDSLQHWVRVLLTLMNSISLSVRTISTDFVVSLFGGIFDLYGNIDETALIYLTTIPEVVAREIALCSVSGLISTVEHVEHSVWPLRRALGDIEETNPLDDDRVDSQLAPILSVFCRACQAGIDGVLIELRLSGDTCSIVGSEIGKKPTDAYLFDADEESLFEVANFFQPETGPSQRLRWLLSLKSLHESKGQWVEAAETLILCARTISDAIPHLRYVWRPSRFELWRNDRQSLWLSTIGKDVGHPDRGNAQVMEFADAFLEPLGPFHPSTSKTSAGEKLQQLAVPAMCVILIKITQEAVLKFLLEDGMEEWAYAQLESLLKVVMQVVDYHSSKSLAQARGASRRRLAEENVALRNVSASLNAEMTQLADRVLAAVENENSQGKAAFSKQPHFIRILLSGYKPDRFKESTTIPTFLEWGSACICRIPPSIIAKASTENIRVRDNLEERLCIEFGKSLQSAINKDSKLDPILFHIGGETNDETLNAEAEKTMVNLSVVHMDASREVSSTWRQSKRFFYRKPSSVDPQLNEQLLLFASNLVELTVARPFPCALSRQRTILTSELSEVPSP